MLTSKTARQVILLNLLAIFATIAIATPFDKLYRQFEDGGFITYFSVIQLFILSYFTCKIFKIRSQDYPTSPWKSPVAIWGILSLGFSFLALDDLLMIHEFIDKTIHKVWQIEETGLTDSIDDGIIALYAIAAVAVLVSYRHELKKYRTVLPAVLIAFALLFAMIVVDAVTNRNETLEILFSAQTVEGIQDWIFTVEDGLKLLAEGFYIIAAHACLPIAQQLHSRRSQENALVIQSPVDSSNAGAS